MTSENEIIDVMSVTFEITLPANIFLQLKKLGKEFTKDTGIEATDDQMIGGLIITAYNEMDL